MEFHAWLGAGPARYKQTLGQRGFRTLNASQAKRLQSWVIALAVVVPVQELHPALAVSSSTWQQVQYWKSLGIAEDLWEFRVVFSLPLTQRVQQTFVCLRTQAGRCYRCVHDFEVLADDLLAQDSLGASRHRERDVLLAA